MFWKLAALLLATMNSTDLSLEGISNRHAPLGGVADCGAGTSLFKITEISQSPDAQVTACQNVSMNLFYTVPEEIHGGKATTSLSLNGLPLTPTVDDLCTKTVCPIAMGDHDGSSWFSFPSGVTGKITTKITWEDMEGRQLLCIASSLKAV